MCRRWLINQLSNARALSLRPADRKGAKWILKSARRSGDEKERQRFAYEFYRFDSESSLNTFPCAQCVEMYKCYLNDLLSWKFQFLFTIRTACPKPHAESKSYSDSSELLWFSNLFFLPAPRLTNDHQSCRATVAAILWFDGQESHALAPLCTREVQLGRFEQRNKKRCRSKRSSIGAEANDSFNRNRLEKQTCATHNLAEWCPKNGFAIFSNPHIGNWIATLEHDETIQPNGENSDAEQRRENKLLYHFGMRARIKSRAAQTSARERREMKSATKLVRLPFDQLYMFPSSSSLARQFAKFPTIFMEIFIDMY